MRSIRDVSTDEQAIANGYVRKVAFKDDLEVMMPCPPMQFSEYAMRPYVRRPPRRRYGQHLPRPRIYRHGDRRHEGQRRHSVMKKENLL